MEDNPLCDLAKKVELLCVRCDALARENTRQKKENQRLQERAERAKKKLSDILSRLPECA